MTKLASSGIVMLQLLPHMSKHGTATDADTDKRLLPGTEKQGTHSDTDKQLVPDTSKPGTDPVKQQLLPGNSNQGTATVNSTDLARVDHDAEAQGDIVTDAGPILFSYQPARVVEQILDDLQAGRLNPPQ